MKSVEVFKASDLRLGGLGQGGGAFWVRVGWLGGSTEPHSVNLTL